MTRKIFKYEIPIADDFSLPLPQGARVLSIDVQNGTPFIWALVDEEAGKESVYFHLAGTGHVVPPHVADSYAFVGTFMLHGGALVFHLFRKRGVVEAILGVL